MNFKQLIDGLYQDIVNPALAEVDISSICSDSRKVERNSVFVALKGTKQNGTEFIHDAIERGARIIVTDNYEQELVQDKDICIVHVDKPDQFLKNIVARFYNRPSQRVKAIGITGTNGKTTITYLIESILHESEHSCGVIGTVNYRIGERILPSVNTTPGLIDNQKIFYDLANEGIEYCVMEVSSHALDQGRVDLIDYKAAIFTNLTSDHLDYHKTIQNYFEAKAKLFVSLDSDAFAIINLDDEYGKKLFSRTKAKIFTYGIYRNADIMAKDIQISISGMQFKLISPIGSVILSTKLVGDYNIYNILAAAGAAISQGINLENIKKGIERLEHVPGRLQRVDCQQNYSIFIDYAHSHDALENVLSTLRRISDSKIILVFGCGGDRDKTKRPLMGQAASQLADFSIVTTDNPRSEAPQIIIDEIIKGFEKDNYAAVVDRKEAIEQALKMAKENDIVLIAGKGHETYQIFNDRTIKFDEREIIRQFLRC